MQFTVSFHKAEKSKQKIDNVHQEVCMSNLEVTVSVLDPDLPTIDM